MNLADRIDAVGRCRFGSHAIGMHPMKSAPGSAPPNRLIARLRFESPGAASMRKRMPWALLAMLSVSGCATTPDFDSSGTCSKENSDFCDVYDVAAASERDLRSNDAAVAVDCPMHFDMPPAAAIMPECVALVGAALVLLNHRFSGDLQPVEPSAVRYSDRAACLDTFVSGREGSDCFTAIRASLPLKWIRPPRTR
ncbi:hypothetical protein [Lysobacter capsici]|uniref:hypothetical protein n=1 Tax=Lysobacter capsici TaxID=435897 RepID=UPI001C003119|nr:hypothetical protein [Lysobacter capsici]QWF14959.1 hypothetical protein KME82_14185 [Lysobacter capsici]